MDVFDWSTLLTDLLPPEWIANRGQNVKIAIIDTGADLGVHSLGHLDKAGRKFFVGKTGFTKIDLSGNDDVRDGLNPGGHGTRLACIMCGKANTAVADMVDGIANEADVFIIKAQHKSSNDDSYLTNARSLLDGIELATLLGAEVAVTAQVLSNTEQTNPSSELQRVFDAVDASGMLLFSAVENRVVGEDWSGLSKMYFPASTPTVINVAAAPADIARVKSQIEGENIRFLLGGFQGKTYGTGNRLITPTVKNSAASAIMTSIAALCCSALKTQQVPFGKDAILQQLAKISAPLKDADGVYAKPSLFKNF